MTTFEARHVRRSGSFVLPLRPDEAFTFFSPEGERAWVPGWTPEYLHPNEGTPVPGLVFRTRAGGEATLWLVLRYDSEALQAEYVRVVPESRIGTVAVCCRGIPGDRTRVEVTYAITSLSEAGNRALESFTERAYAEMMADWRDRITALLSDSAGPATHDAS